MNKPPTEVMELGMTQMFQTMSVLFIHINVYMCDEWSDVRGWMLHKPYYI